MAEKNLNARIVHKHDSEANWNNNGNFIPKQGEIIIYDADSNYSYQRIKIGDGTKKVSELPFVNIHTYQDIVPLQSKTYTGVYSEQDNDTYGYKYYANIKPDSAKALWHVKLKITAWVPDKPDYYGTYIYDVSGMRTTYSAYSCWNNIQNSNYRPFYYHNLKYASGESTAINYGHNLGMYLRNCANHTDANYARSYKIELLECDNCTFTFLDNFTIFNNLTNKSYLGSSSTNFDAASYGLQETGDSNTPYTVSYYDRYKTDSVGIYANTMFMMQPGGKVGSITTSNYTTTSKGRNPNGFLIGSDVFFSSGYTVAANSTFSQGWRSMISSYHDTLDFRYSSNCGETLVGGDPVYLVGTVSNGLFYLAEQWYTQTTPTSDDGKVYIYIGQAYDTYRVTFATQKYWLHYKDGALRPYIGATPASIGAATSGHTHSAADVGAAASGHTHDDRYYTESEIDTKFSNMVGDSSVSTQIANAKYAGSATAGGSATSAVKLDSNAGSATQPIYFKDGKPTATTYSLGKSVPSDAVFTDTNTWRGIQDNLTSDSTIDSLSAKQGKELKSLVDGKAASSHTHKSSDVTAMTGYLKASSASAIAATDTLNQAIGKLEKAIDGKQASGSYSASGHTHDDRYYTETEVDTKFTNMVGDTSVSTQISNATTNYLPLAGGTMTGTTIFPENKLAHHFRNNSGYHSGVMYQTASNEALVFANKNAVTSFMFLTGTDPTTMSGGTWASATPAMQIKQNSVYINKLSPNATDPTHKLYVNGNSRVDGDINISGGVDLKYDSTKKCLSFVFG